MKKTPLLFWLLFVFLSFQINAQTGLSTSELKKIGFQANPIQNFGFYSDQAISDKAVAQGFTMRSRNAYKSVEKESSDLVDFVVTKAMVSRLSSLKFMISKKEQLLFFLNKDSICTIRLPHKEASYQIIAYFDEQRIARLEVNVYQRKTEKCILVPLTNAKVDVSKLQRKVNALLNPALIQVSFELDNVFTSRVFPDTMHWSNPSDSLAIFTGQMRLLRNLYFKENPKASKDTYYLFLIPGFSDSLRREFMLPNKSLAFLKSDENMDQLSESIVLCLLRGVGHRENGIRNQASLSDSLKAENDFSLNHMEWEALQFVPRGFSWFDDREYVKTNNGSIAYFIWKEDANGNIILNGNSFLNAIKRPFKHNFLSYRFDVKYALLSPFYKWNSFYFSSLTILFFLLIVIAYWLIAKKIKNFWKRRKRSYRIPKFLLAILVFTSMLFVSYESFFLGNFILDQFKQVSGPIKEFDGFTSNEVQYNLVNNVQLKHEDSPHNASEILIQKKGKWVIKKRMKVLYFEVRKDKKGEWKSLRFLDNKDSLILKKNNYAEKALTHYVVFNYTEKDGTISKQQVYNYAGDYINSKFELEDIPKRIVLFVNGYRPTSVGKTFEDNFEDIKKYGLENPNSKNLIYNFDRYNYWEQWGQINLMFQNRLNPNMSYYADGHFSVSSSNFKSLVDFTTLSSLYPKRCSNPKKHTCFQMKNPSWTQLMIGENSSYDQLEMHSNKSGFNYRKNKGRIAGKNLLQILNEVPGLSNNDTLYIVAHSMGFAYATGMIESLRGYIQFGSFYILAPENAKAGSVQLSEWKEVWQYGSNLDQPIRDAPCLQDGVAPQTQVKGLSIENRVFIPKNQYDKKGFFDSHFIGYYRWILDLPPNSKGHIPQL